MRLAAYAGTSAVVAAGALLKAFSQRPNFYSATVYLSQSNACILILTNLALVCACTVMYALQRLFYGPLRPIEIEQLSEKAWYAVLDTLLAMPSLRDDVGGWMLTTFVLLLGAKVWSWIGEGRVDILEQQPPQNPRLFHARLSASLLLSLLFDVFMLRYCTLTVRDDPRPGMMVIFTFEFAILTVFSVFTLSRYLLAVCEARILQAQTKAKIEERKAEIRAERDRLRQEQAEAGQPPGDLPGDDDVDVDENEIDVPGWEEKRRWLFALELFTDFVKLSLYAVFLAISLTFMGLPMHILRDVYMTFTSFAKRLQDYSNYRKATQNMNNRYADATAEELSNDNTCIVCREVMLPWGQPDAPPGQASPRMNEGLRAKKLPCGHILHLRCLKAWLERQQACPTCRRPVISNQTQNQQPGAPGGNHAGQAGQAGHNGPANAQPQPRQNRLRMLNLGPIRIGIYNGPAHQVQDALARARNPQAQPGAAGAGSAPSDTASPTNRSTQVQLREVEERLTREARALNLEHSQLMNVRALEAELARLRAQHGSAQAPPAPALRFMPTRPAHNPFGGFAPPQAFQPLPNQQPLGTGHPALPEGMVLPEGWILTPLHPLGPQPPPGAMPPGMPIHMPMPMHMHMPMPMPMQPPVHMPPHMMPHLPTPPAHTPGSGAATQAPAPPLAHTMHAQQPGSRPSSQHSRPLGHPWQPMPAPTEQPAQEPAAEPTRQPSPQQPSSSRDPPWNPASWDAGNNRSTSPAVPASTEGEASSAVHASSPAVGAGTLSTDTGGASTEHQASENAKAPETETAESSSGKGKARALPVTLEDAEDAAEDEQR